ncbi:MAG: hypothetical protein Ct9H90mP27_6310 [Gammaproteobacteria bacterium]|nr:MAG: hypothetical protein Ct9H90mP27_6310 [Gammaproteobacteria bacterium]
MFFTVFPFSDRYSFDCDFRPNLYLLFGALGAIYWLDMARIVRGQTLN